MVSNDTSLATIKKFFGEKFAGIAIEDEDDLFELGLVNSLFAMQIVLFVEQTFGFSCEDEDLDRANFSSIANIYAFVTRKNAVTN